MRYNALEAMWDAREGVEAAAAESFGIDDFTSLMLDVAYGRLQVFSAGKSILLTQVQEYPKAKVFQLCYGAGALQDMEPWLDAVLEWGRQQGCTKVVMIGRQGWQRSFLADRLRPTHIVLEGTL